MELVLYLLHYVILPFFLFFSLEILFQLHQKNLKLLHLKYPYYLIYHLLRCQPFPFENYAASVVRHAASKGYGKSRAVAELARRGIPKELWDDALSEMPESDETLDRLVQAKLHDPQDWDEVRKVSSSLIRRGYSWEEVRRAIDRACNDAIYEETDYDED